MSSKRSRPVLEVEQKTSTAHRLLNYEGVCSNIHGHNIEWEVTLYLDKVSPPDNMSTDFKDVSDLLDYTDHAVLLNKEDPLLDDHEWIGEAKIDFDTVTWSREYVDPLGSTIIFEGDPTCEVLADWMAELLVTEIETCESASVSVAETEKYTVNHGHYTSYEGTPSEVTPDFVDEEESE